jgi:phenylacetate-CoA ligase
MNRVLKNHTPATAAMRRTPVDDLVVRRLGIKHPLQRKHLEQARMQSLRQTLQYAREMSPLYRERLAGFDFTSLRTVADLEKIPLLTGMDIAEHGHRLLCLSQSRVARVVSLQTSGSTGLPKRFSFTADDLTATLDFFLHGMHSLIEHDDRVLVLLPFEQPDSVGELLIRALRGDGIHALGIWPPQSFPEIAATIRQQRLTAAVGLPQHLLALSEEVGRGHLQSMLLCSDYASPALRTRIEAACGCETFLHYGATESGLGGAVECRAHAGCHIRESDLLIEIINPDSGRSVPEGETGEVIITTLGRQAMPLIRYRTGDQACITASPCACGGVTARLCNIRGRLNGHHLPDGSMLHGQDLDDCLFQIPGLLDYRAILDAAKFEQLHIDFLAAPGMNEVDGSIRRMLLQVPAIRDNLIEGNLIVGRVRQVGSFTATHTLKRTILDQRTSRGVYAKYP